MEYQFSSITQLTGLSSRRLGILCDGEYWWAVGSSSADSVALFGFNGTTIVKLSWLSASGNVNGICFDGNYIHVASEVGSNQLGAYRRIGTSIELVATYNAGANLHAIATDGSYIYTGNISGVFRVYDFKNSTYKLFAENTTVGSTGAWPIIFPVGENIFVTAAGNIFRFSYDLLNGLVKQDNGYSTGISSIYAAEWDGTVLHIGGPSGSNNLRSFIYVPGENYYALYTETTGFTIRNIRFDGTYLFVSGGGGNIKVYTFSMNTGYTLVSSLTVGSTELFGGGTFGTYYFVGPNNTTMWATRMRLSAVSFSGEPRIGIVPHTVQFSGL